MAIDIALALWKIDPLLNPSDAGSPGYPTDAELEAAWMAWLADEGKAMIRAEILAASEDAKAVYISNRPGKIFEYIKKSEEVARYDNGARDAASLPIMSATSTLLSIPLDTIAGQWRQKVAEWGVVGGAISAKYDALMLQLELIEFKSMEEIEDFRASIDFSLE